jgi:hypothetical protein
MAGVEGPYRFGAPNDTRWPRRRVAAVLGSIAILVPLLPALSIGLGPNATAGVVPGVWAAFAVPGAVVAAVAARRPRTGAAVAAAAIVEVFLMLLAGLMLLVGGSE